MERVKKLKLKNRRELVLLLALTAFAFLLVVHMSSAGPAYADSPGGSVEPQMIAPPEPGDSPSHYIAGRVLNYESGFGVGGVKVYAYVIGVNDPFVTTTDPVGGFQFYDTNIQQDTEYHITVNGDGWHTGVALENLNWGQWDGWALTNGFAYVFRRIYLEPVTVIDVPAMAMFSNTKYATISYEMTGNYEFSHSMTFSLENPAFTLGYSSTTSESCTYTTGCQVSPNHQMKVSHRHWVATCWYPYLDTYPSSSPSLTTGKAGQDDPSWDWDLLGTSEYLDPNSTLVVNHHKENRLDQGGLISKEYSETGTYKWSVSAHVPFAIQYLAFGATIDMDTTVACANSNTVKYVLDRSGDTNPNTLYFWEYTSGASINIPDTGSGSGGMELHVWDVSGAG
jgi:hypothetical protein